MKSALDWLARTAIVALSMVATLSIIGSIAAIPSGSIEQRLGMDTAPSPVEPADEPPRRSPVDVREEALPAPEMRPDDVAVVAPSLPRNGFEPWLESIAYALIAIAALLAANAFLLWRALGHWRRLADAADRRS